MATKVVEYPPNHPMNLVFLAHITTEIPIGIQGLLGVGLPFIEITNTTMLILKLYGALIAGACVAALACFGLPDFHPGKRAVVIMFLIYHMISSTVLIQAPRFIPFSFGSLAEEWKFTPEVLWGSIHGVLSLGFVTWWQSTLGGPGTVQ